MIIKWHVWRVVLIITILRIERICPDEIISINAKKSLHLVSEQYISISVDPALLFDNSNFSSNTLELARALSPAFIRFTGPSTDTIQWSESSQCTNDGYKITPEKWIALNKWAMETNLTPIFALNANQRINGVWDPRDSLDIMILTDKMNFSCFWELGYDCSNSTLNQYVADITSLNHILDAFPSSKDYWGTIGSDFSGCLEQVSFEIIKNFLITVEDLVDAINWHTNITNNNLFNDKDPIVRALAPTSRVNLPVMLTVPASEDPISFHEALVWASRLGDTARHGFGIIFKQLTFQEMFQDTPAYWLTLVHKHLMGRNVLDVHMTGERSNNITMYAHCARNQNAYSRRGAVAIFGVNPYEEETNMTVKFIGHSLKSNQIHSYILTTDETNRALYLNDEKMTPKEHIRNGRLNIIPKIRQSKPGRHLNINIPPKSIGFFILPSATIPACILNEDNKELVLEEIIEDQNIMSVFSKLQDSKNEINNNDNLSDESQNKLKHHKEVKNDGKVKNIRKYFLDHAKHYEKKNMEHSKIELKHKLHEKMKEQKHNEKFNSDENNNINLENEFDSEHNTVKKDARDEDNFISQENIRKKRFLPVDILQDFAIQNKKGGSNEKNDQNNKKDEPKSRIKRDLDFGTTTKKRGRLSEKLRRRNDESDFKIKDITEIKASKKFPEGDVYIDFKNTETESEEEEKNENYDYIETDEDYDSYEEMVLPVKFIEQPNKTDRKKSQRSNKTNSGKREVGAKRSFRKYSDVDGMELIKQTQNPNEWLDLDANDNFYHVPNEFYENLQLTNVNIRDDLRVYGELWEVDNYKEVIDMTDQDVGDDEDILQYDESAGLTEDPYLVDNAKNHFNKYMQESSKIFRSKKSSKEISKDESMSIDEESMRSDEESMGSDEEDMFMPSPSQMRETKVKPDRKMENYKNFIEQERMKYHEQKNNMKNEVTKENTDTHKKKKSMSTTSTSSTTTPEPSIESEEMTTVRPRMKKSRRPDQVQMYERTRFKREIDDSIEETNKKVKRNLEKQHLKTYKNQLKQKHATERHVRKVDHKEEKRILKHLKNRLKRDVSDTQSKSHENINSMIASIEKTNEITDGIFLDNNFNEEEMLFDLDFEATESPLETQTFVPYFDVEENQIVDENEDDKNNESYEPLRFVIGKPFDQIRFKHVSDRRISNFQRYLKNRLARQRKRLEKIKPVTKVQDDLFMTTNEDNIATTEIPNVEQTDENLRLVRNAEKSDLVKILRSRVPRKTSSITEGRTPLKRSLVNENIIVSDVPILRSLLGRQLPNELQRNKRSLDDNEIFSDEKEKFYKSKWYKIPSSEGKKIVEYEKLKFHKNLIDTDSDKSVSKFITETLSSNENKSNNDEVFIFESTHDDSTPSKDVNVHENTGSNIKSFDVQNLIRENEEYPTMIIFETDTTTGEYPIIIETFSNSDFGISDDYQYIGSDEMKKLISPENQDVITENVIIIPDDSFSSEETDEDDSGFSVFSREKKERKPTSIFGKITPKTRFFDTFLQTISGLLDRVQKRLFGPFGLLR